MRHYTRNTGSPHSADLGFTSNTYRGAQWVQSDRCVTSGTLGSATANLPAGEVYFVPADARGHFPMKYEDGTLGVLDVENRCIIRSTLIAGNQATIDAHNARLADDPMTGTLGELGFGTQVLPVSTSAGAQYGLNSGYLKLHPLWSQKKLAAIANIFGAQRYASVATNPADLSARQVVLQRADDLASYFRGASGQLDQLQGRCTRIEQLVDCVLAPEPVAEWHRLVQRLVLVC